MFFDYIVIGKGNITQEIDTKFWTIVDKTILYITDCQFALTGLTLNKKDPCGYSLGVEKKS